MVSAAPLRWLAVVLLLATALIHLVYGYYAEAAAPAFYGMGIVFFVGVGTLATDYRPRLFQPLALAYTLLVLVTWASIGSRTMVAYVDKSLEAVLIINLALLLHRQLSVHDRGRGKAQRNIGQSHLSRSRKPSLKAFFGLIPAVDGLATRPGSRIPSGALWSVVALGLTLAVILAAGGVGPDLPPKSPVPTEGCPSLPCTLVRITEEGTLFDPEEISVREGETVTLIITNEDYFGHDFTVDELDLHEVNDARSVTIVLFTPTEKGSFTFYCTVPGHSQLGMTGTINVI